MFRHKFDGLTGYCIYCGSSRAAVFGSKIHCYPDHTNLTAIKPYIARRDLALATEYDPQELLEELAHGADHGDNDFA